MMVNAKTAMRLAAIAVLCAGLGFGRTAAHAWPAETTQELAMREGPGMQYPHMQVLPAGIVVRVLSCDDRGWCEVAYGGQVGFLRRRNLARMHAVEYVPPPPPRPSVEVYIGPRPYYEGPRGYYGTFGYGRRW
jgi:uncharacterized protein YraI